jgi:hypothetical protein
MINSLFSVSKALFRGKDQDALIGLYTVWKRSTAHAPKEFQEENPTILKFISSGVLIGEGKVESSIKSLEEIMITTKNPKLQHHAHELLLKCYTSMNSWKSVQQALTIVSNSIPNFDTHFAGELDALSFWNQTGEKYEPDIILDVLERGLSTAIENLTFSNIYKAFRGNSAIDSDAFVKLKYFAALSISHSDEFILGNLVWAQCMLQFNTKYRKLDLGNQIRLGKAKTSERVTNLSFYGSDLLDLMKLYSVYRTAEKLGVSRKVRDPDLDEIGGLLANLARNTRNLTLAHDLLDSPHSTLTLSASIRKQYKQARLLHQEKKVEEASYVLIKVLSTPIPSITLNDQEIIGKSSFLLASWNVEPKIDFMRKEYTDLMQKIFQNEYPHNMSTLKSEDLEYCFLRYAIDAAPGYSKSWLSYGGFNYRLGRSFLDELGSTNTSSYFQAELAR